MSNPGAPSTPAPRRWLRQFLWLVVGIVALLFLLLARPACHLWQTARADRPDRPPPPPGVWNDASRLNETKVAEVVSVPGDAADAEQQLVQLLHRARTNGWKVAIAGAGHTMGGHTLYPGGLVLDMRRFNRMSLDAQSQVLRVQAGARWFEVIPFLRERGRSVAVMQSNHDFTVGGSISANCHGWPANRPPIASTVQSFRLLKADGTIVQCSRMENRELFSLALGGYGLFGVILDVELATVPDASYVLERVVLPSEQFEEIHRRKVLDDANVSMAYGRLSTASGEFLTESILTVMRPTTTAVATDRTTDPPTKFGRLVFRGSVGSDYGKSLRWWAERDLQPWLRPEVFQRSRLLDEAVAVFGNHSAGSTDIVMEYFVPGGQLAKFLGRLREVQARHPVDVLNVTLRHVLRDEDTFLRYADQPMHCAVLLVHQPLKPAAETAMQEATRAMVQAALDCGGRHYLPYRLHATDEQFHAAYPKAKAFFALKRQHDPDELFQNEFYRRHGRATPAPRPSGN